MAATIREGISVCRANQNVECFPWSGAARFAVGWNKLFHLWIPAYQNVDLPTAPWVQKSTGRETKEALIFWLGR